MMSCQCFSPYYYHYNYADANEARLSGGPFPYLEGCGVGVVGVVVGAVAGHPLLVHVILLLHPCG